MKNYNVFLYVEVAVKVSGVQAESPKQAMLTVDDTINFAELLNNDLERKSEGLTVETVFWNESPTLGASVVPVSPDGMVEAAEAVQLDRSGMPILQWSTPEQKKVEGYDRGALFMHELLESVESLSAIAETHGARTLADLLYLHDAIIKGEHIDHWREHSQIMTVVEALPSADIWVKYIKPGEAKVQTPFKVCLTMEDGYKIAWKGLAEDPNHAEGQAIAEATSKTGEQVLESNSVVATVLEPFDQADYDQNPSKYMLFKTARIAEEVSSCPDLKVGTLVGIRFFQVQDNHYRGRAKMPIYQVWTEDNEDLKAYPSMLFACALGDFCL